MGTQDKSETPAPPEEEQAGRDAADEPTPAPPKKPRKVTVKAPARRSTRATSKRPGEQERDDEPRGWGGSRGGKRGRAGGVQRVDRRCYRGTREPKRNWGRGSRLTDGSVLFCLADNPVDAEEAIQVIGGEKAKVDLQGTMLEVIGRALAAKAAGQSSKATMLFKICKGLGNTIASNQATPVPQPLTRAAQVPASLTWSTTTPSFALPTPTPFNPATSNQLHGFKVLTPALVVTPKVRDYDEMVGSTGPEAAVLSDGAAIPNNNDIGLPEFFAKNLIGFRAPLPLTIFNEWWQEKAFLHHAEKRNKSDNASRDRLRYTGFPYPSEYLQTYQEWSVNHQGFLRAVSKIPLHANLAHWLVIHKRNADGIIRREGFMTALRYDIHVRMNALCHRVPVLGGRLSVANISIFRTEIVQEVHAKTVRFGKTEFTDNPYAAGGCRVGWDPTTGQPARKKDEQVNRTPLHLQQPSKAVNPANKPGPKTPRGPSNQRGPNGKDGGFKGGKWGPGYDRDGGGASNSGGGNNGGGGGGAGSSYGKGKSY
ncbi:hypothetical protein PTTG_04356 [Puccinia triticina 1-1 BBBD Race 1]|uniref:Uncharacterized protein n=1 Tax=Puccinia triticina (isolate 1-1 / race 1 (BBBD)) TaxID=630390 RepID=A0A180GTM1_PUCT1|nr:hypothetical protein PTTG_04356 [Puccinia triticina 1-1 BBBD Race 1]